MATGMPASNVESPMKGGRVSEVTKNLACARWSPVTAREGVLATPGSAMAGLGWPMKKRRTRVRTIGPLQHLTLERETDIMRVIALRISPRDAEVPSSTLSADEMQGAEFSTRSASSLSRWD